MADVPARELIEIVKDMVTMKGLDDMVTNLILKDLDLEDMVTIDCEIEQTYNR